MPELQRQLLTRAEVAAELGVSLRTLARLIAAGELPVIRIGAAVRIDPVDRDAYLADHRTAA
jgi:excisionase family DNA binding protein